MGGGGLLAVYQSRAYIPSSFFSESPISFWPPGVPEGVPQLANICPVKIPTANFLADLKLH